LLDATGLFCLVGKGRYNMAHYVTYRIVETRNCERIFYLHKHPNVYIDTSAYTTKRFPAELIQYMKTNGEKKVLFGTNYPMINPAKCLEGLYGLELSQEIKDLFLYKNAKRLFYSKLPPTLSVAL
jgi:predicted TIM-barrel fold metal-dependent hydrolase